MHTARSWFGCFAFIAVFLSFVALSARADDGPGERAVDQKITFSNVAYGLVCGIESNKRVCFQTTDIQLTGEGSCVYNGQVKSCTWYGYSFDYELSSGIVQIDCDWESSVSGELGNPEKVKAKNVSSDNYTIELNSSNHHFSNPQYSVVDPDNSKGKKIEDISESCSYHGTPIFRFTFHLHYPEL